MRFGEGGCAYFELLEGWGEMENVLAEGGGLGGEVCWWFFPVGGSMVYGDLSRSFEGKLGPGYI